ncbi:MAG: class I SAM-dependent methyltransferase [Nitrospirae bacterium]|nr:MAG: class I SAM-dependent methyltransferase [Nitrospirota bacterium]
MSRIPHKYAYSVDINSETAAAKVIRMVGKNKRVLEIGAGPGSMTKVLNIESHCQVTALEIDQEAIEHLTPFCDNVIRCDLNDPTWPTLLSADDKFDVIIAADVLEHLYDPWNTLRSLQKFLKTDGYVVISLPHAGHNAIIASLINGNFEYKDWGLLDKTHIRFFGIKNIQHLLTSTGLAIIEAEFVLFRPEETELADQWRKLSHPIKQSLIENRFGLVYQVVLKAQPALKNQKNVDLISLNPPTTLPVFRKGTLREHAIRMLRRFVVPWIPQRLRIPLHNLGAKLRMAQYRFL